VVLIVEDDGVVVVDVIVVLVVEDDGVVVVDVIVVLVVDVIFCHNFMLLSHEALASSPFRSNATLETYSV
jgi:hypothetical protein